MTQRATEPGSSRLAAYVDAAALLLDLEIEPGWHAGIVGHLAAIAAAAALVLDDPPADDLEPAPVFRA